jgi:serine/threonine protein kinase
MHPGSLRSTVDGKYDIDCALGRGGEGAVYRGRHRLTGALVAVKLMLPGARQTAAACERFLREARLASRVRSEHVVTVHDAGTDPDLGPYLVLEFVEGENLDDRLARGRLDRIEAAACIRDVADGLDEIHHHRIVHRDLKPGNVIVTRRRDGACLFKIADFGIAKELGTSRTTRSVSGTALYMAPEQCVGDRPDVTVDVYALGLLAFEVLTGVAYWDEELGRSKSDGELLAIIAAGPRERASVRATRTGVALPPEFDAFFAAATARDPRQRFQRASEAARAFSAAVGRISAEITGDASDALSVTSPALPARPLPSALRAEAPAPRSRGPLIAGGVLALAVVGGSCLLLAPPRGAVVPSPAPSPAAQTPPPPPEIVASSAAPASSAPREAHVRLQITAHPASARVLVDGAQVPSNPFDGRFPRDGAMHRIQIEASGFQPQSRLVAFERDVELAVTLAPLPRSAAAEKKLGGPKPSPYDPPD